MKGKKAEYTMYIDGPRDYNGGVDQIWGRSVYTLRQKRFIGTTHPHDVCAVDSDLNRLREAIGDHWAGKIDWGEYGA